MRTLWTDKKSKLQVLIPHNDISYIDYWLSEACGLIKYGHYDLALGKIEVLKEITKNECNRLLLPFSVHLDL